MSAEKENPLFAVKLEHLMNIRSAPSVESEILTTYDPGKVVRVLEVIDKTWYRIPAIKGRDAFVFNGGGQYATVIKK